MAIGGIPPGNTGSGGAAPTLADALAGLKTGDVITARVQQALADGVRLAIGRAVIDVASQVALKPGTTVTLQVQRSDSGIALQVVQSDTGQARQQAAQPAQTPAPQPRPAPPQATSPQAAPPQGASRSGEQGQAAGARPAAAATGTPGQATPAPGRPGTAAPAQAQTQTQTAQTAPSGAAAPSGSQPPAARPSPPPPGASPQATQAGTGQSAQAATAPPAAQSAGAAQTGRPPASPPQAAQAPAPSRSATTTVTSPSAATAGNAARVPVQVTITAAPPTQQGSQQAAPQTAAAAPQSTPAQPAGIGGGAQAATPATPAPGQTAGAPAQAPQPTASSPSPQPASPTGQPSNPAFQTVTPQLQQVQAVATARVQAASAQTGFAPLFANLAAAVSQTGNARLEPSVEAAARQLLGLKVPSETVADPARLQGALKGGGTFLEAALARGLPPPEGDLKAALLGFRSLLKGILGDGAPKLPQPGTQAHPPPEQGSNPQAQRPVPPSLPQGADATGIMRQLAADTDGALARMRLLQIASLPDADGVPRHDGPPDSQPRVWQMEVPVGTGRETSVMAIRIERDRRARKGEREGPVWRVRLALELEDAGAISAAIAYAPPQVSVALWAERPETSQALRDNAGVLDDALRAAELDVEGIDVQTGHAPDSRRAASSRPAGGLLDLEG